MKRIVLLLACTFTLQSINILAQEAQWRGPNRDGIYPDTALLKEWPAEGPEKIFVAEELGRSFSSPVANDELIFVTGILDRKEYLTVLDLQGNLVWKKSYGDAWEKSYPDARTTPTVEDNRVYVISGLDRIVCMNTRSGDEIWAVDLHAEYQSDWDMFGVSESPLIVGDKIITGIGGETAMVIALDKMTGELIWKSEPIGHKRGNMSPMAFEHHGKTYVAIGTKTHMLSVDAETGEIMWTYHHNHLSPNGDNVTILTNTPIYRDGCMWITSGWDCKSAMLQISEDGKTIEEKYTDQTFDCQNHGVVLLDTLLYGSNFTGRNVGKWVCMHWYSGEIKWIDGSMNKGPALSADNMLYFMDERRGTLALVKPDADKMNVVSSFKVKEGRGPYWARPAIYNGMLLVRHGDVLIAYNIKA